MDSGADQLSISSFSPQEFQNRLVEWAKKAFEEEVSSDFRRAQAFDSLLTKEHLVALRKQSAPDLQRLARVLPLGVFWNTPDAQDRLSDLTADEREAVRRLRRDYDALWNESAAEHIAFFARVDDPDVREFKIAAKKGKEFVRDVASQWKYRLAGAGPGEWGLISQRDRGRVTVSIDLSRRLTVGYSIAIHDETGRPIRSNDAYFYVLGIGGCQWILEQAGQIDGKLAKAAAFAQWHVREYERIIEDTVR